MEVAPALAMFYWVIEVQGYGSGPSLRECRRRLECPVRGH